MQTKCPVLHIGTKLHLCVLFRTRVYFCELQLITWYTYFWRERQKLPFLAYVPYISHYYKKYFCWFNKLSHKLVEITYCRSFLRHSLKKYKQIIYETLYFRKYSFLRLRYLNTVTGRRNQVNWPLIGRQKKDWNPQIHLKENGLWSCEFDGSRSESCTVGAI